MGGIHAIKYFGSSDIIPRYHWFTGYDIHSFMALQLCVLCIISIQVNLRDDHPPCHQVPTFPDRIGGHESPGEFVLSVPHYFMTGFYTCLLPYVSYPVQSRSSSTASAFQLFFQHKTSLRIIWPHYGNICQRGSFNQTKIGVNQFQHYLI